MERILRKLATDFPINYLRSPTSFKQTQLAYNSVPYCKRPKWQKMRRGMRLLQCLEIAYISLGLIWKRCLRVPPWLIR